MKVEVIGYTNVGGRINNEDRIMINGNIFDDAEYSTVCNIPSHYILCDGVGGAKAGGEAAQFVLEGLKEENLNIISTVDEMKQTLNKINEKLCEFKLENDIANGMFTTIVGISLYDDKIIYYNSGDSRLYRLRNGYLRQLSEDHSSAQEMIKSGLIKKDFEQELMKCSKITRCLGDNNVESSYIKKIDVGPFENDIFLLCSDGLWGVVCNSDIEEIINNSDSIQSALTKLSALAKQNGNSDNISIILMKIF